MSKVTLQDINKLSIGHSVDWKFGLTTRTITKITENKFEIDDTSDGWQKATVSKVVLEQLLNGKKSLLTLFWK